MGATRVTGRCDAHTPANGGLIGGYASKPYCLRPQT